MAAEFAERSPKTGLVVSGGLHLALLAVLVFGFAAAPQFEDAGESVPVETITTTELNQIMEGEKTAKPVATPQPAPPPAKSEPTPPQPPTPPEPQPPEPSPPPEPPTRPEPVKPEPAPPQPPVRPEPPKPETPPPEPPKRPEPPKPLAEDAPTPPVKPPPRPPVKPEETPKPPERPKVAKAEEPKPDKFKPDDILKALSKDKTEDKPSRPKPPAFDSAAISKLIGQGRNSEATQTAQLSQGLANHHAQRMSVSLENALNEWFRDSYKNCWNMPPSNPSGENYVFDVRVTFNPDGSLAARPVMLNPPHDPEWQAHADSVMRAVMRCNPLRIPTQYAPFFDQWRSKTIHFDPASAEG